MRKYMWLSVAALVLYSGCTTKSNRIVEQAFVRGTQTTDQIVHDLFMIATQRAVDHYTVLAREAAQRSDQDAAQRTVEEMATELARLTWLSREQYGRAREALQIARSYIQEQRGFLSVLAESWEEGNKPTGDQTDTMPADEPSD